MRIPDIMEILVPVAGADGKTVFRSATDLETELTFPEGSVVEFNQYVMHQEDWVCRTLGKKARVKTDRQGMFVLEFESALSGKMEASIAGIARLGALQARLISIPA